MFDHSKPKIVCSNWLPQAEHVRVNSMFEKDTPVRSMLDKMLFDPSLPFYKLNTIKTLKFSLKDTAMRKIDLSF